MHVINNTDYQQELMKIIPPNLTKEDVCEIKRFMVKYFAEKATNDMDALWDKKGFTSAEDMEKYLNE